MRSHIKSWLSRRFPHPLRAQGRLVGPELTLRQRPAPEPLCFFTVRDLTGDPSRDEHELGGES